MILLNLYLYVNEGVIYSLSLNKSTVIIINLPLELIRIIYTRKIFQYNYINFIIKQVII